MIGDGRPVDKSYAPSELRQPVSVPVRQSFRHAAFIVNQPPPQQRRRKVFSVKVAGDFSEGGRVCGFRFFGLGEGEVGFASFPGFGYFGEDARDESQQ